MGGIIDLEDSLEAKDYKPSDFRVIDDPVLVIKGLYIFGLLGGLLCGEFMYLLHAEQERAKHTPKPQPTAAASPYSPVRTYNTSLPYK